MDWPRLKTLFADATALPAAERAAYLDAACADDPGLRAELGALLAAEDKAARVIEPFAALFAPVREAVEAGRVAAVRIGAYRLVRELGRGGMGTVYLAERADGQYTQAVALKLIRAGTGGPDAQRRFRAERQILARLAHPHVARLLDGGLTPPAPDAPDGLPYLVMEFVDGAPLPDFCDARRLGVDARLGLFLDVCDAVAYAHQNLVVHRDLKPSNVLVGADGGVKLLDFGIAKLLDDEAGGDATRADAGPMTPAYAAPEQRSGGAVTTATDVYALGLLLHLLLAGGLPTAAPGEEPARPSAAFLRAPDAPARADARGAPPAALARRLRGDLDTIILAALRAEPARRYPTAAALADDVRRHLAHLPVRARPSTAGYRAGRFVRRHRAGVAAAALVALAVVGGAGAALWQAALARGEARKARATLDFLQNTLYAADPITGGPDTPIRVALDSAAAHVDRDLGAQPLVAAGVHSTVGFAYNNLGFYAQAQRHHRRSADLYARAGRRHRLDYAIELLNLGLATDSEGRSAEATGFYERALPILRAEGSRTQTGSLLNAYGSALMDLDRPGEAEARLREAITLWRADGAEQLPLALNNLAVLYESRGRAREAVPLVEEAVRAIRARGAGGEGTLGPVLGVLGALYDVTGRSALAATTLDSALAVLRRTLGPDHPATVLNEANRALAARRAGRVPEAVVLGRAAYHHAARVLEPGTPYHAHAAALYGHALCGLHADSARAGGRLVEDALAARRDLLPPTHWLIAHTESLLGECRLAQGRVADARSLLERGHAGLRAARGDADFRTVEAARRVAALQAVGWERWAVEFDEGGAPRPRQ